MSIVVSNTAQTTWTITVHVCTPICTYWCVFSLSHSVSSKILHTSDTKHRPTFIFLL